MKNIALNSMIRSLLFFGLTLLSLNTNAAYSVNGSMNNQYAIVFFFESTCAYCHRFAPILRQFSENEGVPVYDFSVDGKGIDEFPAPIPSTPEVAQAFFENPRNIVVPATFLINVNNQKYVRVSRGQVSYEQLKETYQNIINDPEVMGALQ